LKKKHGQKLINKVHHKKSEGRCCLCGEEDYAVLDCHRIKPGEEGGRYVESNVLVICANCHRKIHDDQIVIDRKYNTTSGTTVLHFWDEDGEEQWV
jgi:hypothetical protein